MFERYQWSHLNSVTNYLGVTAFILINLTVDLNNFFYKFLIWVPASHTLLKVRIFIWGFAAMATSKEWYEYISNPNSNRLGPFAWVSIYVAFIELSGVMKFKGT